ncbi:glucosaminidase domain-containing protein [Cohnella candidum]|nr:glucosaminidase domain-containing protein [Cohnella candidum]
MIAKRLVTLSVLVLAAVLLLSFFLYVSVSRNTYASAAASTANRESKIDPRLQIAALVKLPPRTHAVQLAAVPVQTARAPQKPRASSYVTTAFYLNIREEPSSKARILKVVEKGTELNVIQTTDNGWLRLEGGGYVHGGYAQLSPQQTRESQSMAADALKPARSSRPYKLPEPAKAVRPADPTPTVRSDSGLTEEHIARIFEGTALEGQHLESAILEIEEDYGINAYFTIAVMKLESGNGKSRLAKSKNNLFGLNATGNGNKQAYRFDTKADSVRKFGQLIAKNYVGKGYTTVEKVAQKYCPANSKWPRLVKGIMVSDHVKLLV